MRPMTAILFASMCSAMVACTPHNTSADEPATPEPQDAAATPAPGSDPAPAGSPPPAGSDADLRPLPTTPAAPGDVEDQDSCNPEGAQRFVGQAASADVVEQARTAANAEVARVLTPGQMVTMEFRAGRLNIDVDAQNVITNVRCG